MVDYNRTVWKDHIKDQNGNIIQQGVPASAKNLNNIENQLVILSAKENTLSELVKENIPSGFTSLSDLDYTYMSTNPNAIKLLSDSIAFVNGYKVVIPTGTLIQLDIPPVSGSRDDLVFLECWKQTDVNGSVTWNWRIRVVSGVDFSKTYLNSDIVGWTNGTNYTSIRPQGSNASVVEDPGTNTGIFNIKLFRQSQTPYSNLPSQDVGLWIAGDGTSASKTALGTTDGYVYAIPLFRVHRRNSGGYSITNANGANSFISYSPIDNNGVSDALGLSLTVNMGTNISYYSVGDRVLWQDSNRSTQGIGKIQSISANSMTISLYETPSTANRSAWATHYFVKCNYRKNNLFADIVVDRDIIDLRHQVSLTGFNYQQLLEENFDKLLRGELQTNAKTNMIKHYHGIPKTPIDANHVFYASLDGTTVAEVGGALAMIGTYKPMPTGLGIKLSSFYATGSIFSLPNSAFTIDMFMNTSELKAFANGSTFLYLNSASTSFIFRKNNDGSYLQVAMSNNSDNSGSIGNVACLTSLLNTLFTHIRVTVSNNSLKLYINGAYIGAITLSNPTLATYTGLNISSGITICDLALSNIDRGAVFATLPQDVTDGYARISPAFNEQRNVFSDALTSETDFVQVKAAGSNGKAISTTQGTAGAWASGDKVKVRGLGGEIITGVIDSDTALARILNYTSATVALLDDVSKLAIGDVVYLYKPDLSYSNPFNITAIDTVNKTITINANNFDNTWIGGYIIETTASSSAPTVKYLNGATLADVVGTWSNLGTNEATFTLGTNASLTTQDLYITYGLNEVAGQGGISEVLTATLAGESNGKKLVVNPTVHVRDDFAGKVTGDMVVCPNIVKYRDASSLLIPSNAGLLESNQLNYDLAKTLNGSSMVTTSSINGNISQQLFSFNLIRILEDKFGPLPCGSDIASKVAWLKANIKSYTCNWWGYGSCPSGSKAVLRTYYPVSNTYYGDKITSSSSVSLVSLLVADNNYIDSNGFAHFLASTDASDGVTSSVINTDYANIEITLNTPTGYDVLGPENPRRDDGKANILLVRKETKEIQSMFSRSNTDGVITYGDYVPYQGCITSAFSGAKIIDYKAIEMSLSTGRYDITKSNFFISQLPLRQGNSDSFVSGIDVINGNTNISATTKTLIAKIALLFYSNNGNNIMRHDGEKPRLFVFINAATQQTRGLQGGTASIKGVNIYSYPLDRVVNNNLYLYGICIYNNELYLFVEANTPTNKYLYSYTDAIDVMKIPNRPLIK